MQTWRKLEFRGRDPQGNPFVDFGFIAEDGGRFALTSHMLRTPLWAEDASQVLPCFKHYYAERGFSQLRYKVLWDEHGPVDTAFEEGWSDL
jgi:hypothetical protein